VVSRGRIESPAAGTQQSAAPQVAPAVAPPMAPPIAPPVQAAGAPPAWLADPRGRHQLRYWDGTKWTDDVSDNGAVSKDPV
jgi:hypothetical protein